jgi:hypothetical protein
VLKMGGFGCYSFEERMRNEWGGGTVSSIQYPVGYAVCKVLQALVGISNYSRLFAEVQSPKPLAYQNTSCCSREMVLGGRPFDGKHPSFAEIRFNPFCRGPAGPLHTRPVAFSPRTPERSVQE